MSFSERLKIIIEEDYKTQSNFAEAIRVTKASVNDYLSSKRKPNFDVLKKIAELGYNMNWLLTGEGTEKKELFNYELLDKYDNSLFDYILFYIGGPGMNKRIVKEPNVTINEKSKYILEYLYQECIIEALFLNLTYSRIFSVIEKYLNGTIFNDALVFNILIPAINKYIESGEIYEDANIELNDQMDFIYCLSSIYVVYLEINELEQRIKSSEPKVEVDDMKGIYKQIYDLIENDIYLSIKAQKFNKIVANTFNYELD